MGICIRCFKNKILLLSNFLKRGAETDKSEINSCTLLQLRQPGAPICIRF